MDEDTLMLAVTRSYDQRAVVYTSEGLTLLAVDFVYALQSKLARYSLAKEQGGQNPMEMNDMVEIARRLVTVENQGRSLTSGYMERLYTKLFFSQESWKQLSRTYEAKYGERGILVELDYRHSPVAETGEGSSRNDALSVAQVAYQPAVRED